MATTYASFLASAVGLHGTLVMPERVARDLGLLALAAHLVLQVWAGFAIRRLLVRIGLDRAALAGGLFFAFTPSFVPGAAGEGADLGASLALLMLATERCLAPRYAGEGGVLALAAMVLGVAMCGGDPTLEEGGGLALLWALGRLATPLPFGRRRAVARVLAGAALGLLVAIPLTAGLEEVAGVFGVADPESVVRTLESWAGWLTPPPAWDPRRLAMAAAPTLPLLAAGVLGVARRRAYPIRAALGVATLLAAGVIAGRAGAPGENAIPVLFLAAAGLAAIAVRDAEQGRPAALRLRLGVAIATVAAAASIAMLLPGREMRFLALGEAACALLALRFAGRPMVIALVVLLGALAGYETPLVASILPS